MHADGGFNLRRMTMNSLSPSRGWAAFGCLLGLTLGLPAAGQGTLNFANILSGVVDARVYFAFGGPAEPADGRFVAQLMVARSPDTLVAVGPKISFRSSPVAALGYFPGQAVEIPFAPEGATVQVRMVAWPEIFGSTYAQAVDRGIHGESPLLQVTLGGGLIPPLPAYGLEGFTITALDPAWAAASLESGALAPIPEPSVWWLGGVGCLVVAKGCWKPAGSPRPGVVRKDDGSGTSKLRLAVPGAGPDTDVRGCARVAQG